ncbi:MAG: ATP-binding cassette, subfamily bacterial [Patescibacteria group bacterium]|nr:ATP-binding cassette, subfamily bacterial [Patescibacteria group bacterium]
MKNIFKILKISKPLHHLVAILAALIVVSSALALASPILSKFIVDEIMAQLTGADGNFQQLVFLIGLSLVISLFGLVTTVITERIGDHFQGKLRQFLTERFYDKVLTLPQSYFDSEISGKIVNQLNRGISSIYGFLNTTSNFIAPTFVQSIFTIAVLAYYDIPIAILTFLLFPIYLSISHYSTVKWGESEVKKNVIEDITRGRIQEVISNIKLVKSFIAEKKEFNLVKHGLTDINDIYAKQSQTFHIFDFYRGLSLVLILFIISVLVFYNTFNGVFSVGEMVLILQLVNQARMPLFAMSFILTQIQMAESGSKEFFEVMELSSTEDYKRKTEKKRLTSPTLRFHQVKFHYEENNNVLNDVSFEIHKNESVALVGHSGAGKSTIISLLLKFYLPTSGKIFLNDRDYAGLDATFVRNNIALVFQENELFSSTIRENVAYGMDKATDEEVIKALKMANAYDFVMTFPKGIESEVGERGVKLSGGQKQRIQIARAILKNAPILILDEATSSLDARSEKEVQDALENLMKNKLVIIIAHRFSTIQNVSKIIVLNKGTIVDYGSPAQLAHKDGIYKDLLTYQVEGNKKLLASYEIY